MPNGGEHYERLGVCPQCRSPSIRIRQQRHRQLLWRCRICNGVFRTPDVADYIIPPGDDGSSYVLAESIPQMELRGRLHERRGSGRSLSLKLTAIVVIVILLGAVGYFIFMAGLESSSDGSGQPPGPDKSLAPAAVDKSTPSQSATAKVAQTSTIAAIPTDTAVAMPTKATPFLTAVPQTRSTPMSAIPSVTVLSGLKNGRWLIQNRSTLATSIAAIVWVEDGIATSETEAVQEVVTLAAFHEELTASLIDRPWFADGVTETELEGIKYLGDIAYHSEVTARQVATIPWFVDDITEMEVEAVKYLFYIAYDNTGGAERIAQMPFLTTVEPVDVSALDALADLAGYREESLEQILAHPSLASGITDALAPIVAMLYGVAKTNPSLTELLLDPYSVSLERRSIKLPLTGDVYLVIVRTKPGAARGMDLLEHSVRASEQLMGEPFPTRYVGLLYEDAVSAGYAGTNFGTHIAVLPKYDVDDGSHEAEFAPHNIYHEVAHYYWSGNADWVDEGIADFMASAVENKHTGRPIGVTNDPCAYARSITELTTLAPDADADHDVFGCNYSLGERLFADMYGILGESAIWQGFGDLYIKSLVEDDADDLKGTALDIKHVREVFRSDPGALISIGRWYDRTEDYDLSQLDLRPADPALPSINGQVDEAYVQIGKDGPSVSSFSVEDAADHTVWLNLDYSYNVTGGPHKLLLDVVEFYEDGFEFRRHSVEIAAESQYIGGWSSVSVGPEKWATGRYWMYLYDGDRKIADVQYEVTT